MEKLNPKNPDFKKPVILNGYILSIQSHGMPPVYSYVPLDSKLESIVSDALKSHPNSIILIQASTDL